MSDELRTPKGRTLLRRNDTERGELVYSDAWGTMSVTIGANDIVGRYDAVAMNHYASLGAACDWLDARADETVAALLPPGAIVVTEERVRELLGFFPGDLRRAENRGDANEAIDEFLSALRAGAQS